MTNEEFYNHFLVIVDKIGTDALPLLDEEELSVLANDAQENLILDKYDSKQNKNFEGFEQTEKRSQEIGDIVRYKEINTFTSGFFPNAVYVELPNTLLSNPTDFSDVFWFTVYEECETDLKDCDNKNSRVDVLERSHNDWAFIKGDPFNKPNKERIIRLRSEERKHQLITDGTYNILKYFVGYIRKPIPIDLAGIATNQVSELSDSFHRELLEKTIYRALKTTDNPRIQTEVETSVANIAK